jgi:hypothetical protein
MDKIVEYGLGSFTGKGTDVTVAEPLALTSIFHYFKRVNLPMESDIRNRMDTAQGLAFEEALLVSYTTLFRNGARLDEVFTFHGPTPTWARQKAIIVASDTRGVLHPFDIITSDPIVPSTGVSLIATDPKEVEAWLKNVPTGWCLPGKLMGPDLMAWLLLEDGKLLLLLIQGKCFISGNKDGTLKASVIADAIRSLTPSNFYVTVVSKLRQSPLTLLNDSCVQPSKADDTRSMLSEINKVASFTGAKLTSCVWSRRIRRLPRLRRLQAMSPPGCGRTIIP